MNKILENLLDVEKKAEKVIKDAERSSEKLINIRKDQANLLMSKASEEISEERQEAISTAEKAIKAKVAEIEAEGDQKAASVAQVDSSMKEKAKKIVVETILE